MTFGSFGVDSSEKEKKKQYETKKERNFQENWADEFPGVRHAVPLDDDDPKNERVCYLVETRHRLFMKFLKML
jgi:hypothetical protein